MKNTLKRILATAALGTTLHAADISGNVKYVQPTEGNGAYPEANVFYSLPLSGTEKKINGYSWADKFNDNSYIGQTQLTVNTSKNISAMAQMEHSNRINWYGLGAKFNIPIKNGYTNVKVLPVYFSREGEFTPGKSLVGFSAGYDFQDDWKGWKVEAFGEIDVSNKRGKESRSGDRKASWAYGRAEVRRTFMHPNFELGVGVEAFKRSNKIVPKLKPVVLAQFNFDFDLPRRRVKK